MEKVYERCCGLEVHKKTVVGLPPHARPPSSSLRARGSREPTASTDSATPQVPERRGEAPGQPRSWAWADLLRRGVDLDGLACPRGGGRLRLLATSEDPQVIRHILAPLGLPPEVPCLRPPRPPPARAAALVADLPA
jgi:hypothetical protein